MKMFVLIVTIFFSLNPQNGHQLPSVMVLCGPHLQGAYGVNCARQLSNHNVKVQVFMPGHAKIPAFMEDELALFDSSDGKRTSSLQGIINLLVMVNIRQRFISMCYEVWNMNYQQFKVTDLATF